MAARKHIDPIASFMQDHDKVLLVLASLNKATRSIVEHGYSDDAYRRLLAAMDYLDGEVGVHNMSEEKALFPVLERYVEGPTRLMRADHKVLKKEFHRLRRAAEQVDKNRSSKRAAVELGAVSKGLVQLFVNHIHKENHILFPLVQKFLTRDALREIARRMIDE